MHQVNIEYLARVVMVDQGWAFPDVCLGTDSHTTMVNGLGVLGWGIGGIEAEAVMLGESLSMLLPRVVGFRLHGELPEGHGHRPCPDHHRDAPSAAVSSGSSSSSTVPGSGDQLADRATIANMSPEFGSTCAYFPIDEETLRYLRFTGRPRDPSTWSRPTPRPRACGMTRTTSRCTPSWPSSTWAPSFPHSPAPGAPRTASGSMMPNVPSETSFPKSSASKRPTEPR